MADLVEALRTGDLGQAKVAMAALEAHGLHPTLLGESLSASIGAGPAIVPRRVMVPEPELAEAQALLEILRAMAEDAEAERSDPETCPSCAAAWEPGFDECWHCQAPHPGHA